MKEEEYADLEDKIETLAKQHKREILCFRAPENPKEKEEWVRRMARIQFAMWIADGAKCCHCGKPYLSVDDFLRRNPKRSLESGSDFDKFFVDSDCWEDYVKSRQES